MTLQLLAVPRPTAPFKQVPAGTDLNTAADHDPTSIGASAKGLGPVRAELIGSVKCFISSLNRLSPLCPLHPFTCK
jgi:hypothetical protein